MGGYQVFMQGCFLFLVVWFFGVMFVVFRLVIIQWREFIGLIILLNLKKVVVFIVFLCFIIFVIIFLNSVFWVFLFFCVFSFLWKFSCIVFFSFIVSNFFVGQDIVNNGVFMVLFVMVIVLSLQVFCRIIVKKGMVRLVVVINMCVAWCINVVFFVCGLIIMFGVLYRKIIGILKVLYNCMKWDVLLVLLVLMVLVRC